MIRTAYIIMYTYTVAHTLQSLITIVVIVYTVHCHLHKEITDMYTILILSLIHISEPTRRYAISYAVFCLKKKK